MQNFYKRNLSAKSVKILNKKQKQKNIYIYYKNETKQKNLANFYALLFIYLNK